ncbi:MAG: hypothetical protein COB15_03010 [Flavobacteriales bacterium]|nr:MAG: hypothetical protein COB15_03010 [Flavobacteriales bacterium]
MAKKINISKKTPLRSFKLFLKLNIMNLENLNVQELNTEEMKNVDGGADLSAAADAQERFALGFMYDIYNPEG